MPSYPPEAWSPGKFYLHAPRAGSVWEYEGEIWWDLIKWKRHGIRGWIPDVAGSLGKDDYGEHWTPRSDHDLVKLLREAYYTYRICWVNGGWLVWDGRVFVSDGSVVGQIVHDVVDEYRHALTQLEYEYMLEPRKEFDWAVDHGGDKEALKKELDKKLSDLRRRMKPWWDYSRGLLRAAGQTALTRAMQTRNAYEPDAFDEDVRWLVVQNGMLDLDILRTGGQATDLRREDHRPEYALTQMCGVEWQGAGAECPEFMGVLAHAFPEAVDADGELKRFVQRAFGSALLGEPWHKALINLLGVGDSGKSLLLTVMRRVFGSYAEVAPHDALTRKGGAFDMEEFRGARLVTASETDEYAVYNTGVVKQLTGGSDEMKTRGIYGRYSSWTPRCLVAIGTNHEMVFNTADTAMLNRLRIVPFRNPVPPSERDKELPGRLVEKEGPGILAWLVEGARMSLAEGLDDLPCMVEAREEMARKIENSLEFLAWSIEAGLVVSIDDPSWPLHGFLTVQSMYELYKDWCVGVGDVRPEKVVGRKTFASVIGRLHPRQSSNGVRFTGLAPSTRWEEDRFGAAAGSIGTSEVPIRRFGGA